ncbi:MAG: YxeA family protein [Clostridiales Family XIII bacterium]|jgi:uncharacterized protein (TIGR01655 family)|nr:YxeA family protein [Clostridiales Family XIII bacterium]
MRTKKRTPLVIVLVVVVALAAVLFVLGRQYYNDRYVGTDYYTMVPLDFDATPVPMYADDGEQMGMGKEYTLTVYNEAGESREVSFNVYAPGSGLAAERELPLPGAFLRVKASKTIVTNWNTVGKDSVPAKVLERIEGGQ